MLLHLEQEVNRNDGSETIKRHVRHFLHSHRVHRNYRDDNNRRNWSFIVFNFDRCRTERQLGARGRRTAPEHLHGLKAEPCSVLLTKYNNIEVPCIQERSFHLHDHARPSTMAWSARRRGGVILICGPLLE